MADAKIVITAEDRATGPLKGIAAEFDRFGSTAANSIAPLLKLQGALVAVAGSAVVAGLRNIVGELDDLAEAAQGVGTSAVALAELRQAAAFAGVDAGKLDKALSGLASRLDDAAKGGKESAAIFSTLGVAIRNNDGTLRATDAVLGDLSDRFAQFRDGTEKTALANQIFGEKLGRVLIPYLNQGSDALRQYAGVSEKSVKDAEALQAQIDKLSASWDRLRLSVGGAIAGLFNQDTKSAEALGKQLKDLDEQIERASRRRAREIDIDRIAAYDIALEGLQDQARRTREALDAALRPKDDTKPAAPIIPTTAAERIGPRAAEGLTEAQRALAQYVNGLERALQATEDLSESEKAAAAIRSGAFGEVTPQVRQLLMTLAERADATKALRKIEEDAARAEKKEFEDRERQAKAIADWQIRLAQETSNRYTAQSESLRTETERVNAERTAQLQISIDAREADLISEEEYQARRAAIMERFAQMSGDIEARRYGAAQAFRELDLKSAGAFFNQMSGLMNSQSRKLFEVGKAGAIAETVVNTYSAAMAAYKSLASIPIVGPALGAAAAAAAVATGVANVQRIRSTQFGGGGSVTNANVTTPGQGPFATGSPGVAAPAGGRTTPAITITLTGSGRYSAEEVRSLINQINEQAGLGASIVTATA
jgi:hypothetical protein